MKAQEMKRKPEGSPGQAMANPCLTPWKAADSMGAIAATTSPRPVARALRSAAFGLMTLGTAAGVRAELGASLGFLLPADRLSGAAGWMSSPLRPAPSLAVHGGSVPGGGWGDPGWDVTLEAAQFESDADRQLRLFWIPLRAGPVWEVATVEGAALTVGLAAGGAVLSVRAGGPSTTSGAGYAAATGRIRRALHAFTVSLGLEAGVVWHEGVRPLMAVRVRIDSGGG